ncbi:hypothetical protein GGQ80_001250 [Sphingomonas jinjuensis]|uniref:Fibronectin type III-like domain-containing protein n=1 Tax=Sphingomonas jinjuensis TaxID=535907 RepID=A0A840FH90_9SPHN|nr:tryptophan 7-halogenase [Sphingomonas jinjuensis]MBB4153348.1 hypothetical protein [Sphingomonas jinjuensis]
MPDDRPDLAAQSRVVEPARPYPRSIAHTACWQWRTPLQHRVGNGIVIASAFIDEDEDEDEVAARLVGSIAGERSGDPRHIRYRTGRRQAAWTNNVVALDLSPGFVEPLESTGLSYTRLAFVRRCAGHPASITVTVRNVGAVAGGEVSQLYVEPVGHADLPRRSLKGFERVRLAPGEARHVTFTLDPRDLAFADAKGAMRWTPGSYRLWGGGGQDGTGAPGTAATIRVTGSRSLPK